MIESFVPDIYQKSIYYINYDKLYKKGIRCIIFDLDNTLTPSHVNKPTKRLKRLIGELKDIGFKIIIVSNFAMTRNVKTAKKETHFWEIVLQIKQNGAMMILAGNCS